ncbi:MAG TPA: transglycosylase SLT domain-containing protein [Ktedonobacteraceae bacterium]
MYRYVLFRVFSGSLKRYLLLTLTLGVLSTSFTILQHPTEARAARVAGYSCFWYKVRTGDTLTALARRYHSSIKTLARTNAIRNANLIRVHQRLCIPRSGYGRRLSSGLLHNGIVRWYAYDALEHPNRAQTTRSIRRIAALYGLPANLMLAIAWQESGWRHHVIARDGGIGTMQLMPYTAYALNKMMHKRFDPYKLQDNLHLSAIYLRILWRQFGGNRVQIISAYNEGGYAVRHKGIFNWPYVNNVLFLTRRFS